METPTLIRVLCPAIVYSFHCQPGPMPEHDYSLPKIWRYGRCSSVKNLHTPACPGRGLPLCPSRQNP
jgi:hypothetical protein